MDELKKGGRVRWGVKCSPATKAFITEKLLRGNSNLSVPLVASGNLLVYESFFFSVCGAFAISSFLPNHANS
jgi:hypothetical protein